MDGSLPSTAYGNTKVILNSYLPGHQQQHQAPTLSSAHYDPNNAYQNESLYQPYQQLAHPPPQLPPPPSDHHHHHHHHQQQQQQHHQLSSQLNQLSLQDGPIPMQHQHQHQQHGQHQQHQPPPPRNVSMMHTLTTRSSNALVADMNNHPPQAVLQQPPPPQQSAALPDTNSFFVSDFVKEEILKRLVKSQELPSEAALLELPSRVDVYIELLALEPSPGAASYSFNGMASSVYRATNSETGQLVCLRRFHAFTPSTANAKLLMATIEGWKKVAHANIVPLRQVFTTKAFGDNSVIFVYDYYPASETLMGAYFANQQLQPPNGGGGNVGGGGGNSHVGGNGVVTAPGGGGGGINGPGGGGGPGGQSQSQQQQHQLSTNGYSTASRPYSQQAQNTRKLLPEATIWNYIIQISSALRTIHQSNLACRALDPSKVLLTSGWSTNANNAFSNRGRNARLRLAFAGVPDILTLDAFLHHANPRALVAHFQQEDLLLFGRLCLALAANNLAAFNASLPSAASGAGASAQEHHLLVAEALELVPRSYSADLRTLIGYLLSFKATAAPNKARSIDDIMPMIGARFYMQLDHLYYRYDHLYEELAKEADNGRLLRLLAKLGTINERPEHQLDPNWSETGDRYMLKLFRDYLFHQCDEEGRPWLDLGHIITNLNKMDVGSGEKICLVSRDAQNVIIVSFEELKRCFEAALADLMQ